MPLTKVPKPIRASVRPAVVTAVTGVNHGVSLITGASGVVLIPLGFARLIAEDC